MANNTPPSEKEIFKKTNGKEPIMKWMHKLIIPRISYCWRKLADYLEYPVEKKKEIEERQRGDPYECCAELMQDWLTSDRGVTPKTWHTLVSVIKEVTELKSSAKSIEQLLLKEGLLSYPLETETATNQKHDVTDHQLDQQQATGSMDHSHNAAGSRIQIGIEYIKSIVGSQFTEQEMIEALQHTKINAINALDYLLKKGTELVDTPELSSKVSGETSFTIEREAMVNFTDCENIDECFSHFTAAMFKILSQAEFPLLRRACLENSNRLGGIPLPKDLKDNIMASQSLNNLFDVLCNSPYWNWMNIKMLVKMTRASHLDAASKLIQQYKDEVYSRKVMDVLQQIPKLKVSDKYYTRAKEKWKKSFDDVTVNDLVNHWSKVEQIFDVEEPTVLLDHLMDGCVEVTWLIPTESVERICQSIQTKISMLSECDILCFDIGGHSYKCSSTVQLDKPITATAAPSEPEELTIQSQSATHNSLTLSWKPPKASVGSSFQYRVEYRKINEEFQKLIELSDNLLTYKVTELSADTEYYFRVAAMNSAGCGPYKDAANSHFTKNFPPNDLKIIQDKDYKNEVTVSWKQPNKPADKYVVQYKKIVDSEEFSTVPCDSQKLTCTVKNLTAGNEYQFRVAAINERGDYGLFAEERCHIKSLITEDELSEMVPLNNNISNKEHSDKLIGDTKILIITANKFEYDAVLCFLKERRDTLRPLVYNHQCKIGFISKDVEYVFGEFAGSNAAVHKMTSQGPAAAQSVITEAAQCFGNNLKEIFAVGFACGIGKSKILDVIVADKITSYNSARFSTVNEEFTQIPRSVAHLPTKKLVSYFYRTPRWPTKDSKIVKRLLRKPEKRIGEMLTGNYLIDNKEKRDDLVKSFAPEAIAIEMEGAGLFHDINNHQVKIVLVKAVSDFGDGGKHKEYQPTAALLAAECVHHYLSIANKKRRADIIKLEHLKHTTSELENSVSDVVAKMNTEEFTLHNSKECGSVRLLLITVSKNEFHAALYYMANKHMHDSEDSKIPKIFASKNYYYIGNFAKIPAALVWHKQGKSKDVASEALKIFANLKAIIAIGVCGTYGELGDVIVSSEIVPYSHSEKPISETLLNFLQAPGKWEFNCTNDSRPNQCLSQSHYEPFCLSTQKLETENVKDAMGIDIEGSGIVEAIKDNHNVHFIIVKAGCGYADEKPNEAWEPVAAMAATSFVDFKFRLPIPEKWFTEKAHSQSEEDATQAES